MTTVTIDAARLELLLTELRLPGFKLMWAKLAEQSDKEGWPAARFLAALAEQHKPVRRESQPRHDGQRLKRRPVRRSRQSAAGKPL